ncbi:MAG: HWE histidine kinase domain-containing protein [Pseudomonadota bacterium]
MSGDLKPFPEGEALDLTNCDREPIHALGRVQSYGALLAISSDWIIQHASENIDRFLGASASALTGTMLTDFVPKHLAHDVRSRMQMLAGPDAVERLFNVTLKEGEDGGEDTLVDLAIHRSDRTIVIELESADASSASTDFISQVRPMIDRISKGRDVEHLCQLAARQLRGLVGFDRVMVYRFEEDDTGTVVAEALRTGLEPYLGLRYPASDIPKQARALYKRSLLRTISDVNDEGFAIVPPQSPEGAPLDLSLSSTRAVSPIHLEYLRNMGVQASLSVSILKRGKLWGLFACHHEAPRVLPYSVRTAAELFGQLFAFVLDQKEADIEREERDAAQRVHDRVMAQLAGGRSISANFETLIDSIQTVIAHDGAVGWVDGEFVSRGATPTREEFLGLAKFLNTTATGSIFTTDNIEALYPAADSFADRAAGLLVLPVSRRPRDYIVLFRREIAHSVTWAGNPEKPVEAGPNGVRLTPRKSFEAWQQVVRNKSARWTKQEVGSAEALRVTLLEVVLRMSDEALEERGRAQERQELLIAELNHRVRNILNLIRGLVAQSAVDAHSAAELTQVIGGRIHALARAHDQITRENWSAASLRDLVATECEAYIDDDQPRVEVVGPDIMLEPMAFSTMALVVHELVTNAAKYGALSVPSGRVTLTAAPEPDGDIKLRWREEGGPPIQAAPERRGFGSTIIERSVPYDLKGEAKIHFDVSGLVAEFMLPARAATVTERKIAAVRDMAPTEAPGEARDLTELLADVLIVEDNMIIALDTEDTMAELGARQVRLAASSTDALKEIDARAPSFALLDVNLGTETSGAVAIALAERQVPFAFATGYGEETELSKRFVMVPVLKKPYGKADLAALLAKI